MQEGRLTALLEPLVESLGYELLLLEFNPQGRSALLRLYLDGPDGVTLGDCEKVSREVAALLDVEDPISVPFNLEVSSPGLDRPLAKPVHYQRQIGQKARLELVVPVNGQRRFVGIIQGADEEKVTLAVAGGNVDLALSNVLRARLVPNFRGAKLVEPELEMASDKPRRRRRH